MNINVPAVKGAYGVYVWYCSLNGLKKLPWFMALGLLKPDAYNYSL